MLLLLLSLSSVDVAQQGGTQLLLSYLLPRESMDEKVGPPNIMMSGGGQKRWLWW